MGVIWKLYEVVCKSLEVDPEKVEKAAKAKAERKRLKGYRTLWSSRAFGTRHVNKLKGTCRQCQIRLRNGYCPVLGRFVRKNQRQCGRLSRLPYVPHIAMDMKAKRHRDRNFKTVVRMTEVWKKRKKVA